jgi:hypothetical protein
MGKITSADVNMEGIHIEYAGFVGAPGVSGILVDCGMAKEDCRAPQENSTGAAEVGVGNGKQHHVCFIQRG